MIFSLMIHQAVMLQRLGVVRELTSRKRNRIFSYTGYLEIMNQGPALPD